MSQTNGRDPHENGKSKDDLQPGVPAQPDQPVPPVPPATDDIRAGTVDFNYFSKATGDSSGSGKLSRMSEPISGGSVISWAELLRQQQIPSDEEVNLGSLPDIQVERVGTITLLEAS